MGYIIMTKRAILLAYAQQHNIIPVWTATWTTYIHTVWFVHCK
jgi:hypothetical protein